MSNNLLYISDLDGTLCDTLPANIAAYKSAFEDAGLIFNEDIYRKNFGLRYDEMIRTIAPNVTSSQIEVVVSRKQAHYKNNLSLVTPNKALISLLTDVKSKGILVALATTARRENAEAVLTHLGMADFFDAAIYGEDVAKGKPNPECYIKASQLLAIDASKCLVFEDSEVGVTAANDAGMLAIKVRL